MQSEEYGLYGGCCQDLGDYFWVYIFNTFFVNSGVEINQIIEISFYEIIL